MLHNHRKRKEIKKLERAVVYRELWYDMENDGE
jgi:hypothetical protein